VTADDVKARALALGFASCGIAPAVAPPHGDAYRRWLDRGFHASMDYLKRHAPLKQHPERLLSGARSVIAVTLNYNRAPLARPKIARYALGRDYHKVMRSKLNKLVRTLSALQPDAQFRVCVDSAPILDREFAWLAGLGWYGKNTCLIDSKRGSWFFIGLVISTLDLQSDQPAIGSCGSCTACIKACPTGAIVQLDGRWQVDSRKCISYWTIEHRGSIEIESHGWVFGCDVCQEVCPFNQPRSSQPLRAAYTLEPDLLQQRAWPESLEEITEGEWDRLTQGSAVRRAGFQGLRRNALLAKDGRKIPETS
jgi:epoxyqueuosine reductase